MTRRHKSLVQSLLGSLLVPGLAVMVIGVLIVQHIFKDEYDELLDASLIGKAHLLVEFIETAQGDAGFDVGGLLDFESKLRKPDERALMWYLDPDGQVYAQSKSVGAFALPTPLATGLSTAAGHRFIMLRSDQPETGSDNRCGDRCGDRFWPVGGAICAILLLGGSTISRDDCRAQPEHRRKERTQPFPD